MKIEKNDMVMVYDGGGTVPHCKYTGRFGDLTAYWQKIVSALQRKCVQSMWLSSSLGCWHSGLLYL